MKNIRTLSFCLFVIILPFLYIEAQGQDWREITPLKATCEDVKKVFAVDACNIPVSRYKFENVSFTINFSEGNDKWKVPRGTVTRVVVFLRTLPPLKDIEPNLEDFEIIPEDDLPSVRIYKNDKRGISITAQKIWSHSDEEYVSSIILYPPICKK